jgi:4-alpha-glucanotransferase
MSQFLNIGRGAGILIHPTSLPTPYGIGDLGPKSRWFVDFLVAAKQKVWCLLPLGPTGPRNSPYESLSAFAGNPLLISPDLLIEHGYLAKRDLLPLPPSPRSINFSSVRRYKSLLFRKAFASFSETKDFLHFQKQNRWWLDDFSAFMSLHEANRGAPWARFDPRILPDSRAVRFHQFLQYEFFRQWHALHKYAGSQSVSIMGDLSFYVEHNSADVWAHRDIFNLDRSGEAKTVGGVPPDYFSRDGQRWGTPTYNWRELARTRYRWWIDRLRFALEMVDLLRLDHFRGFEAFWSIKSSEPSARRGKWIKAPGTHFFSCVREILGDVPLIAENLGMITPSVERLRCQFSLPGMRVLQFGFDDSGTHLPANYVRELVCYTGTHDNDTTVGWWHALQRSARRSPSDRSARDRALAYFQADGFDIHWKFIREVFASAAQLAIVPMQDVLGLGSRDRMNQPGRARDNWRWRLSQRLVTPAITRRLAALTASCHR